MTDAEIFAEADPLSIMGHKLHVLIKAARSCIDVPGSVCEVGVYRGGSGLALCRCFPFKFVFLVDTFEGIPEDDIHECGHKKGEFKADHWIEVGSTFIRAKAFNGIVLRSDIRHPEMQALLNMQFAFIHLDCDIEQSTRAATDLLLPRLSLHGGVFFDDYGHDHCPGVKIVVDELMATGGFEASFEQGTAFLVKMF